MKQNPEIEAYVATIFMNTSHTTDSDVRMTYAQGFADALLGADLITIDEWEYIRHKALFGESIEN